MIRINDIIYPISNIKQIKIDWDNNSLTYYFMDGLKIAPIVVKYNNKGELIERAKELTNEQDKKPKRLFG